jgi:hypothetical protein
LEAFDARFKSTDPVDPPGRPDNDHIEIHLYLIWYVRFISREDYLEKIPVLSDYYDGLVVVGNAGLHLHHEGVREGGAYMY